MTTMNNVNKAMELVKNMIPMLEELNNILLNLDCDERLDGVTKGNVEVIYRELNDVELLEDLAEILEQAEEIDPDYEFELEHDPNDWEE